MRLLLSDTTLNFSAGKKSFEEMLTVDGNVYTTYKDVCYALGFVDDDQEWVAVLNHAVETRMCPAIRELFVTILILCQPAKPRELFESFYRDMWDDFEYSLHNNEEGNEELLRAMVILDIEQRLQSFSNTLENYQLPTVDADLRARVQIANRHFQNLQELVEIREELDYDHDEMIQWVQTAENGVGVHQLGKLQYSQQQAYDAIIRAVERRSPAGKNCFFLKARGGTGKTYVLNSILKKVRTLDQHSIALAVAASGIAATLLQGGRTVHSRFKTPLKTDNSTVFDIKKQSNLAQLILKCKVVVWDEAAMNHRH